MPKRGPQTKTNTSNSRGGFRTLRSFTAVGPETIEQLFRYPEHTLECLLAGDVNHLRMRALVANFQHGISISTDYSGMGCFEIGARALEKVLMSRSLVSAAGSHIRFYRCSDVEERCRATFGADQDVQDCQIY
eukprot:6480087-Amphidinium_carterae.1